ncbi:MAG: hypothetical protein ACRD8A_03985 [Candidatus Acidiferrales bacterium]
MSQATVRLIFRWIHIVFGLPIIGYIYDSPKNTPYYAWTIRELFLTVLLVSGLWMWKGHVVRRFFSRRSARAAVSLANGRCSVGG